MINPELQIVRDGMRTDAAKACIDIADKILRTDDYETATPARSWITTAAALDKAAEDRLNDEDRARLDAKIEAREAGNELRELMAGNVRSIRGRT